VNLKSALLRFLQEHGDDYFSGAALARQLGVSRNAVWKAVESLRCEGFDIAAVTNKGYRLISSGDVLSQAGITGFIKTQGVFDIKVQKKVTSTNTIVCELAAQGAKEGYVLAAQEQTAGKGRQGRGFHSPADHGVYFSLLLRPGTQTNAASLITSAAAVAAARAIEEVTGVRVGIKWVNDLFVNDKKVCGILTEAVFDMESGLVSSAVVGIGINITRPDEGFPEELDGIATSLTDRSVGIDNQRCRLIAATLDHFWIFYRNLAGREFLEEYKARSIILGKNINVISVDGVLPATAIAIDDDCGLTVRYENGQTAILNSGDVSIRL